MIKFVKRLFVFALLLIICVGGYFFYRGNQLYKQVVDNKPICDVKSWLEVDNSYVYTYDINPLFLKAVVAVEDQRFFYHSGFDVTSTVRAIIEDIKSRSFSQGGSTITQQLAKTLYFSQEKTIERKIAELLVAFDLEATYSKEEILEMYVNTIYYGSGYYGVRFASQGYFECEPKEMSAYESTLLAGIPNAPSVYSLNVNPDLARQRQLMVLDSMVSCGYLSEAEAEEILKSDPEVEEQYAD